MIGILEDKKGFRKEVYMPFPYPEYKIAEWDGYGTIAKEGDISNQPVVGKTITFQFMKKEEVFSMEVAWYKEIR